MDNDAGRMGNKPTAMGSEWEQRERPREIGSERKTATESWLEGGMDMDGNKEGEGKEKQRRGWVGREAQSDRDGERKVAEISQSDRSGGGSDREAGRDSRDKQGRRER